jgi:hypothetical protein
MEKEMKYITYLLFYLVFSFSVCAGRDRQYILHRFAVISWDTNDTSNIKYNVYRHSGRCSPTLMDLSLKGWVKLNRDPIMDDKYIDDTMGDGVWCYMVAASGTTKELPLRLWSGTKWVRK